VARAISHTRASTSFPQRLAKSSPDFSAALSLYAKEAVMDKYYRFLIPLSPNPTPHAHANLLKCQFISDTTLVFSFVE